jgi:two-component system CheB/CheR fusion protein
MSRRPPPQAPTEAPTGVSGDPSGLAPGEAPGFLVVGIGASAGGLEAAKRFVGAMPADSGMAFILVQHQDPSHESMMVELLTAHTSLSVMDAVDGQLIAPDTLYVISPGTYVSIDADILQVSKPSTRHGARRPVDALLTSMAASLGPRAVAVILSGTGDDGASALKAIKAAGGFVIAQEPAEAAYDGMPRSAIATGAVDLVLATADMAAALQRRSQDEPKVFASGEAAPEAEPRDALAQIIELLRTKTTHDFRFYKQGTLERRIERRMTMAGIKMADRNRYLALLRERPDELAQLGQDLLINVTRFFRDPAVFEVLEKETVPELVRNAAPDQPLRVWIAGCSTGEETYSLAMLFLEQIAAAGLNIKLQIFASDVDAEAVATAREGLYADDKVRPDVSEARLANFFTVEGSCHRIAPQLRACVVFTVQDILSDPPFSRIDMVSCRNLLIYLQPEAQAKAISLFHFALRQGGVLLLGSSETVGDEAGRFEVMSKKARLYRHVGRARPGDLRLLTNLTDSRPSSRRSPDPVSTRRAVLAALCQRLVLQEYAPAAVLIDRKHDVLFSVGATDRFLQVATGFPDHDLLSLARDDVRPRLRSAIARAIRDRARITAAGGKITRNGVTRAFSIDVMPVVSEGEDLALVCFLDDPEHPRRTAGTPDANEAPAVKDLERELEVARRDLQGAIHDLEVSGEEQKTINAEALSVNEEYQATNEELVASKEELQSLNEELTALNSQLQETLERQRTTSNDLQNVLYSTNVATLFLDTELKIRFFTPSTTAIFRIISTDIGRPLGDLNALAADADLLADACQVLQTVAVLEREVEGPPGTWYTRRILPYRTQATGAEGVVITYVDVTERRVAAEAVETAKRQAERANAAKSRFLAAASHDLRQPLQTMKLVQGLLAKTVEGEAAKGLVVRLADTMSAMSGMLNALLDINQIEAGTVQVRTLDFPIDELLTRLKGEFTYHAQAHSLDLRVMPCGLHVCSDPRLLEQMLRNLVSNALKYTHHGKVLLGCRRRGGMLSIEVWDTGIGIPQEDLKTIFEEYHQLDNPARERSRGLGLGLSIVQRLGGLLGHLVQVRSKPGRGSVFSVELARPRGLAEASAKPRPRHGGLVSSTSGARTGWILVIEDDPDLREMLELVLEREGHRVSVASDGAEALKIAKVGGVAPDLVLTDYNLPGGMDGLKVAAALRAMLAQPLPVIVLTGDISTRALQDIAAQDCLKMNKPVNLATLSQAIQHLLPEARPKRRSGDQRGPKRPEAATTAPVIFIVDDDRSIRDGLRAVLEHEGRVVEDFEDCDAFLRAYRPGQVGCLLVDACLPGMSGLELLNRMRQLDHHLPAIVITGNSDVQMAVEAMKAGASDFIEKPVGATELLDSVDRALDQSDDANKAVAWREAASSHLDHLTARQREIMTMVLAGSPSKNIAADLHISQRTVENHRASIMKKTGAKSLPALARLAMAAGPAHVPEPA